MAEPIEARRGRKRKAGALDQLATIVGGGGIALLAIGVLGPVAAFLLDATALRASAVMLIFAASGLAGLSTWMAVGFKARAKAYALGLGGFGVFLLALWIYGEATYRRFKSDQAKSVRAFHEARRSGTSA